MPVSSVRYFSPYAPALIGAPDGQGGYDIHPAWAALSVAGMGLGAYHGYKRNNSVGWGVGWGLLGGLFPIFTIPISLAQGFGKRA